MVPIQSTYPMEIVCIEYLSLERSSGGYENVLVTINHLPDMHKHINAEPHSPYHS